MKVGLFDSENELAYNPGITSIDKHSVCSRMYFFTKVLGLQLATPILNLVFGSAWHAGKDKLLVKGVSMDNLDVAMEAFLKVYQKDYHPSMWNTLAPKNPDYARESLISYIELYKDRPREIVGTEISGTVFVDDKHSVTVRLDLVERDIRDKTLWVVDHKTAGNRDPVYAEILRMSNQMTIYMVCANMNFDNVGGVRIERSLFLKTELSHSEFFINNNPTEMLMILNSVQQEYERIDANWDLLLNRDVHNLDKVMLSFPLNTNSCIQYNRMCAFRSICLSCPNPLTLNTPPIGFKQEFYNPLAKEEDTDD